MTATAPAPATVADRRAAVLDPPSAPGHQRLSRLRAALSFGSRSLRLRVVVMTLVLSTLVIVVLGIVLQQQIADGLVSNKRTAALSEMEGAIATAGQQLQGADQNPQQLQSQMFDLQQSLGSPDQTSAASGSGSTAGIYEIVIGQVRPGPTTANWLGCIGDIPAELQAKVAKGIEATQYATVAQHSSGCAGGDPAPALIIGAPVRTQTDTFGLYLVFLLTTEQKTLTVVQQTLLIGGAALDLALALIAFLVASAVLRPIRRASAVAGRLAAGDLAERMPVRGAVELTTLARSFNGMAEAIRAQINQLEEFGRLQRQFSSDVSHELRTPLTTVRMAADTLYDDRAEFPAHLSRATELLVDELDRFESLLTELLEISRYDAGMAELNAERVDVRSAVLACVAAAGPVASRMGVRIVTTMPPDPVTAEVDVRRLERIVRNLINNAIDHAEGGTVDVELAADDEALAVAVTDHGVGLKPGEASLVFIRFWRADPSRQRQTGGTGMGLAISLEDARLHGGWLQAWGLPGQGARFRLTLPRRRGVVLASSPLPLRFGPDAEDEPTEDGETAGVGPVAPLVGGGGAS